MEHNNYKLNEAKNTSSKSEPDVKPGENETLSHKEMDSLTAAGYTRIKKGGKGNWTEVT